MLNHKGLAKDDMGQVSS